MSETASINPKRFHLCDIGDGEDAFLICGECAQERDPDAYEELDPLPADAPANTSRTCFGCGQTERELLGGLQ